MRGDCSTYGALKKFPSMWDYVEDDAYKHYNSGNDDDNMNMLVGPPEEEVMILLHQSTKFYSFLLSIEKYDES